MKKQPKGIVEQATIDKWKEEHPEGVYQVTTNDGEHTGYFRNPTLEDLDVASNLIDKDNPLQIFIQVGKETFLGGSDAVYTTPRYQNDFKATIMPLVEGRKMKLAEL